MIHIEFKDHKSRYRELYVVLSKQDVKGFQERGHETRDLHGRTFPKKFIF